MFKQLTQLILIVFLLNPFFLPGVYSMKITSDPRVELCSIVFYLAGAREYSQCRFPEYLKKVDQYFKTCKNHELIKFSQQIRANCGISYDAVMQAAIILKSTQKNEFVPLIDFDKHMDQIDKRWNKHDLLQFYKLLEDFSDESNFNAFYKECSPLFAGADKAVAEIDGMKGVEEWFKTLFPETSVEFVIVPAALNGGACYGISLPKETGKTAYCILGVHAVGANGLPLFTKGIVETIFHEFCHSHTNPLSDMIYRDVKPLCEKLFKLSQDKMRRQAYVSPETFLAESLVRGCTASFIKSSYGEEMYKELVYREFKRGFFMTEALCEIFLLMYQQKQPVNQHLPTLLECFAKFARNYEKNLAIAEAKINAYEKSRPQVVGCSPENNSQDVDPDIKFIEIKFDQPMFNSWSLVGGGEPFPKITGKVYFDEKMQKLTVPVDLLPEHEYWMWLNSEKYLGFSSQRGLPLLPFKYQFRTRKNKWTK